MNRTIRGFLLAFVLISLLFGLEAGTAEAVENLLLQTNLLQNPSFEEPYSSGVAQGWGRQHEDYNSNPKPANCGDYYTVLPSWSPELATGSLILDGGRSQHIGNQFDTWRAVVMQDVTVNPGSTYRFSFWSTGRASNDQYPAPSDGAVNLGVRGGIDPNGGGSMLSGNIVWGASGSPHMSGGNGNWQQFSVEATAATNKITVFAEANNGGANNCRSHLDIWFDKAELVEAGPPPTNTPPPPPPPPPVPVVTNTPVPPPPTPTSDVPPTETPVPTDIPTNTPEPPIGGEICANAFADANQNGVHDPDEGWMAGVTLSLIQNEQILETGVSTGTETAVCFISLSGIYTVAQTVPRNLELTNAPVSNPIEAIDGSSHYVPFGSWFSSDTGGENVAEVTPEDSGEVQDPTEQEDSSSGEDNGLNWLAIIGLGAIILAIILLAALIVILLRQQNAQ
ncbi:MAG: hypothetical protein WA996_20215 [Candidatus Promineifilaceae bacterium]